MMRKGKRKSASVHWAAAVILTCYLAQTIDCYRLTKTERREGRKEADAAKTVAVHEGRIVFGRVFESKGVDGTKKSSNASVEDEAAYQADFAGWSKGQAQDASSKEARWKRMAPSLQCGGEQLKFRAVGPGASQFAVEQENAPPMPLSQVPPTCGYSTHKNSLALVMLVPYDGCNMVQQGGNYVLPMRWQGIPVSLWCPKPAAPAPSTAAPQNPVPQTPRYPPSYPQVPQMLMMPHSNSPDVANHKIPLPYFFPPNLPHSQYPAVVPEPTTTTTSPKKPDVPDFPQYPAFYNPFFPQFPHPIPVTTAAPTTTTTTTKPKMPQFPQYPSFFNPFYPYFPPPLPVTTAAPTTTKSTTTTTTAAKPGAIAPPQIFPFPFYQPLFPPAPWPYPGPLPATTKPTTTQSPTTEPTTKPQAPLPPYMPFLPPYPFFPPPFPPFPLYPTPKPETTTTTPTTATTTTTKTNKPLTPSPSDTHPHYHPHIHFPFPYMPYPPHV